MKEEISAAVVFISRLAKSGNVNLTEDKVKEFSDKLEVSLNERFKDHWYQETPTKGQGYRCIRMNEAVARDPVIVKAAEDCGLEYKDLKMPPELTIWVDPKEVCCRFGEAKGSWCTLFKEGAKETERVNTPVIEKVLKESRIDSPSKPIEVTRSNGARPHYRPSSASPPQNHYFGNTMRNFNHNHNNNLNKYNKFNRGGGYPPRGPGMNGMPQPPPSMMAPSISPTFPKNKFSSSPPNSKFHHQEHHQFQQRIASGRNDRFHWVRGHDLRGHDLVKA